MVATLYRSRWLLYALVARDLVLRYRGTIVGFFWTLLNPLLFVAAYTLVFSIYLRSSLPHFALFLLAGIIPWQWFLTSVTMGTSSIVDGRGYVGQSVFRPAVLIFVPIMSNFVNYLLFLPLLLIVVFLLHQTVGWPIVVLPLLIVIQFMLTAGFLFISAIFNVFFRDLQQLLATLLTLLFFLTPIFYSIDSIPARFRPIMTLNPMLGIITAYQHIFYHNTWPDFGLLGESAVISVVVLWIGLRVFAKYEDALPDYL